MARIEQGIHFFGVVLLVGVVAEVWSGAIAWALCVAVGVAGEVFGGIMHAALAKRLRALTDRERREQLEVIARLRLDTERLRADNLDLERRIQPRELLHESAEAIARALAKYAGLEFSVFSPSTDAEAGRLAVRVRDMLLGAAWAPKQGERFSDGLWHAPPYDLVIGVRVRAGDFPRATEASQALAEALMSVGIAATPAGPWRYESSDRVLVRPSADEIEITVGVKPLPDMMR